MSEGIDLKVNSSSGICGLSEKNVAQALDNICTAGNQGSESINSRVGKMIKKIRKSAGLSQKELAAMLSKPVTFQQLQKYENGTNSLSVERLVDIAKVLGVPLYSLLPSEVVCGSASSKIDLLCDARRAAMEQNSEDMMQIIQHISNIRSPEVKNKIADLIKSIAG